MPHHELDYPTAAHACVCTSLWPQGACAGYLTESTFFDVLHSLPDTLVHLKLVAPYAPESAHWPRGTTYAPGISDSRRTGEALRPRPPLRPFCR